MKLQSIEFYQDIELQLASFEAKVHELSCRSLPEMLSIIIDAYAAKKLFEDVRRCCLLGIRNGLLDEQKYYTLFTSLISLRDYELIICIWNNLDIHLKRNLDLSTFVAHAHHDQGDFEDCIRVCIDILDIDESRTIAFSLLLSALVRSNCSDRIDQYLSIYKVAQVDSWFMYLYYVDCKVNRPDVNKVKNIIKRLGCSIDSNSELVMVNGLRLSGNIHEAVTLGAEYIKIYSVDPWITLEYASALLESIEWHEHKQLYHKIVIGNYDLTIKLPFRYAIKKIDILKSFYKENNNITSDFANITSILEYVFSTVKNLFYEPNDNVALVGATMGGGGAECVLANVHLELQRQHYAGELWLYSINSELGYDFFIKALNIKVLDECACFVLNGHVSLDLPFAFLPGNVPGGVANNCQMVFNFIKERRPRVIHAWQDDTNLEVAFAAIVAGVPKIILHPHNMRPEHVHNTALSVSFKRAYRVLLNRADVQFVCVSKGSLLDYLNWLELEMCSRYHVIYNGFDFSRFTNFLDFKQEKNIIRLELGLKETEIVIGGCFRFVKVKRPQLWIQVAMSILKLAPEYKFVLFGDGPELAEAQRIVGLSGFSENIVFLGQVEQAGLKSLAFDVILHTSESEGLPTVLIEAQANGVPAVASDVGGTSETLISNFSHLVDADDINAYTSKIFEAVELKNNWALRRRAAQTTRTKFSVEKNVERLRELYS